MMMSILNVYKLFSHETGLNLIIETVTENGPAWKCGVRPGDVIVTVDDWLITVMDKPQVNMLIDCTKRTHSFARSRPCHDLMLQMDYYPN